jgi:catechol 2,3-dioxygenase-like lactoylglutathione lyase family enzyme
MSLSTAFAALAITAGLFVPFTSTHLHAQLQNPPRPAITGLAFVRVYSADPAASRKFYGGILGYDHTGISGLGRYTVNESQWIEVVAMPTPAPQGKVAAIGFTTRNIAALEKYLKARNVTIVQPLHNGHFGIKDPEGRLVEFVQQTPPSAAGQKAALAPLASSHRIIHTGFTVQNRAAESSFYHDLLGFTPYWEGGRKEGDIDYVCLQVPDGTDWVEYMMNPADRTTAHQLGSANHIALGMEHMSDTIALLKTNGCTGGDCGTGEIKSTIGRSGRVQLSIFDPDETRAEYMEFAPARTPCCSPMTGRNPTAVEDR